MAPEKRADPHECWIGTLLMGEMRREGGSSQQKINGVGGGDQRCQSGSDKKLKFSFSSLVELSPSGGRTVGVGTGCSQKLEHRHTYQLFSKFLLFPFHLAATDS